MSDILVTVAILGGITGIFGAYAAVENMRSGRSHAVIERAQFLEEQVTKLSKENDDLLNENIHLTRENSRLRGLLARRQKPT